MYSWKIRDESVKPSRMMGPVDRVGGVIIVEHRTRDEFVALRCRKLEIHPSVLLATLLCSR